MIDTGFLFRTGDRSRVQDYWKTIDVEQGGTSSTPGGSQEPLLDALAHYVNYAIPIPVPPADSTRCRSRAAMRSSTASAARRATSVRRRRTPGRATPPSIWRGRVLLHDVGTCVTTGRGPTRRSPTRTAIRAIACAFDTPTLRGLSDSAPYLHDGSAATLEDVFRLAPGMVGSAAAGLPHDNLEALVTYLRSL